MNLYGCCETSFLLQSRANKIRRQAIHCVAPSYSIPRLCLCCRIYVFQTLFRDCSSTYEYSFNSVHDNCLQLQAWYDSAQIVRGGSLACVDRIIGHRSFMIHYLTSTMLRTLRVPFFINFYKRNWNQEHVRLINHHFGINAQPSRALSSCRRGLWYLSVSDDPLIV